MDNSYQEAFEKMHKSPRNLRQIFEDDEKALQREAQNSLRYQKMPHTRNHKVPRNVNPPSTDRPNQNRNDTCTKVQDVVQDWSTLIAKVAHGFNGANNMGRVGVALLRNNSGKIKLFVYKSKSQVVATRLMTEGEVTSYPQVVLRDIYMQFYDDEKHFWSIQFDGANDRKEFAAMLTRLNLNCDTLSSGAEDHDEHVRKVSNKSISSLPTPLPRHQQNQQHHHQQQQHRPRSPPTCDSSGDEQIVDIIDTSASNVRQPTSEQKLLVPLTKAMGRRGSIEKKEQIGDYLQHHYAKGQAMDEKLAGIVKVMNILSVSSGGGGGGGGDGSGSSSKEISQSTTKKVIIPSNDVDVDELLELEQKLLDFKKENRTLMKSLQAKEAALADLRSQTSSLCEELLAHNRELKKQNSSLIAAMSAQSKSNYTAINIDIATNTDLISCESCENCPKAASRIRKLERRVAGLQDALINAKSCASFSQQKPDAL